jgi:hypothetical protein
MEVETRIIFLAFLVNCIIRKDIAGFGIELKFFYYKSLLRVYNLALCSVNDAIVLKENTDFNFATIYFMCM